MINTQKRRRILINRPLQLGALAAIFFVTLVILAFHTWLVYGSLSSAEVARATITRLLLQDVTVTILATIAFFLFVGVRGTHKVAGPLHRFQNVLKKMQKGDLTEVVHLRNDDMLLEFMGDMNMALANLRELLAEERLHLRNVRGHLDQLRIGVASPELKTTIDQALAELSEVGKKVKIAKDGDVVRARPRRIPPWASPDVEQKAAPAGGAVQSPATQSVASDQAPAVDGNSPAIAFAGPGRALPAHVANARTVVEMAAPAWVEEDTHPQDGDTGP